jgi:hypothetical protein
MKRQKTFYWNNGGINLNEIYKYFDSVNPNPNPKTDRSDVNYKAIKGNNKFLTIRATFK